MTRAEAYLAGMTHVEVSELMSRLLRLELQILQPGIVTADEMRQILELDNAVEINEKSKKAWIKQESWRTKGRRRFA